MTRSILYSVLVSIVFAGIESAADAAGAVLDADQGNSHEVHGSAHSESHEHDGNGHDDADHDDTNHDDDHFCHCSVHSVALLSSGVAGAGNSRFVTLSHYEYRFSWLANPPLLRPPNN